MKVEMTMSEVLAKITMVQKQLEELSMYKLFSDAVIPEKNMTLCSKTTKEESEDQIRSNFDKATQFINNYIKLKMVKEYVNTTVKVEIPNPDFRKGGTVKYTIAEILSLKIPSVIRFYNSMKENMKTSYNKSNAEIEKYKNRVLSEETISSYVTSRLANINDTNTKKGDQKYQDIAAEFINANRIELLDPINIVDKIDKIEQWYNEFYTTIGYKLSEANATTKVWIDLDLDEDFWGLVE